MTQTIERVENQLTIRLDSIFAFAHLGMELKMRRNPTRSLVSDYYATIATPGAVSPPPPRVIITSAIDANNIGVIPSGEELPFCKDMMQRLPIIGQLFCRNIVVLVIIGTVWNTLNSGTN